MGKLPAVKEFEGMGARYTVASVFGGLVEFDDKSVIIALTVAGHGVRKLIYPLGTDESKAASFYRRFAESARKVKGEGLTEFEKKVFRATIDHSFTEEERAEYHNPDRDEDLFTDLPSM